MRAIAVIISFGWTSDAVLAGFKDTTRRDWTPRHVRQFHAGQLVDAWNATPRVVVKNPHKFATIRLTADPELSDILPREDYDREGFKWLDDYGYRLSGLTPLDLWNRWEQGFGSPDPPPPLYIIRFEVVEFTEAGWTRIEELRRLKREVRFRNASPLRPDAIMGP